MHIRGWKRLLALTMALATLLATPALAERAAYVSDYAAPVYADASFGERIGSIARGSYLTVNAETNGVADITYYGKDGYMPVSALTYVQGEAEDAVLTRQTRFYQSPDKNSAYGPLDAGTAVRLMSVNGDWAMIEYNEHIGFVMRSDLRTESEGGAQATAAPEPEQGGAVVRETFSAIVNRDGAYVYRERSTASQRMQVARGRALTVVAYNDEWAQVYNGSAYAFIPRADIDRVEDVTAQPTVSPTATPEPEQGGAVVRETFSAIVNRDGAYVYRERSTASQRMQVARGRALTVVAYNDEWAQVYNGSAYAFIPRADIDRVEDVTAQPTVSPTATPEPEQGGAVVRETFSAIVNRDGAYVYRERSTASQRMQVARGRALTVVAYNDEWAQVYNGSAYAFIPRADIDRVEDVTAQPTVSPTATPEPEQGGAVVRETFSAIVNRDGAYVYRERSTASQRMQVARGRALTVVAYNDEWAQVYNGSAYAFIPRTDIDRVEDVTAQPTVAPTATPEPEQGGDVVRETFTATVTKQGARVYQSASTDAASEELAYGATVTVVAYDDTWAQLAGDGRYGFTQRENLTRGAATATPTPAPTPTPGGGSSFDEAVESGDYSNEELTFLYLTREAGLNTAAACGLLANIKAESSFRPTAYNPNGGSYGICQWTGGRKTRLQNYCEDNGLDYTTLHGQLQFTRV